MAAWIPHVREHHRRAEEDIVFTCDAFVDAHVVLHLHVVAEPGARHDHHVLPETAPLADDGAAVDVAEMPDARASPNLRAVIDVAGGVHVPAAWHLAHLTHANASRERQILAAEALPRAQCAPIRKSREAARATCDPRAHPFPELLRRAGHARHSRNKRDDRTRTRRADSAQRAMPPLPGRRRRIPRTPSARSG